MGYDDRESDSLKAADRNPDYSGVTAAAGDGQHAAAGGIWGHRTWICWLLPGLAAGFFIALAVTYQEYHCFAEFTGAVLDRDVSVWEQTDQGDRDAEISSREKQEGDAQKRTAKKILAAAAKSRSRGNRESGEAFLHEYGYHTWGRLGTLLPFTLGICILLSEIAGWCVFRKEERERKKQEQRMEELTRYLLAAERGEAAVLLRREDAFSHLEDAVYKAVMELKGTKEEAVRSHEVLSQRIADVAHQLKTPITSMSLMTELLGEQETKEGKECLRRLTLQIHRLQNLVHALLSLAKLESHTIRYERETLDLEDLIESAAEPLRELLQNRQIWLEYSGDPVSVRADRQWTEEAILNVIKNCAEHTPEGGQIQIRWEKNPLYTEIRFTDSGKGFSKKDLPHLFERFYRGENAQKDSAGIGLALAKLVVEQQEGHIYAENTRDGHACFILRFFR